MAKLSVLLATLVAAGVLVTPVTSFAALGEPSRIAFAAAPGALPLVEGGHAATLVVDANDWPGVIRAVRDLQADVERVSSVKPDLAVGRGLPTRPSTAGVSDVGSSSGGPAATAGSGDPALQQTAVIVGTLGKSALLDALVRAGKLDVAAIRGQWESWISVVIDAPLPGIDRALVIAGSDKRGAIYGVYDVSEQIGISPWYWWADVPPQRHTALYALAGRVVHGAPAVKYRGIFLNDEAPDLTNWVRTTYGDAPVSSDPPVGKGVANYGRDFYRRIFELMLRIRANYLWPAMWSNAFNEDDPENARLADEYGIVMGTSHQEPMLRSQQEWDRRYGKTLGSWNYAKQADVLEAFWREGIRRNRPYESIVTLGLRGANDTEMAPGGPEANRALLEHIVGVQRRILTDELSPDIARVPQVWCLYKEVQDYYDHGMRVPDDVTLLWADDNWGNLRRLPTAAERQRSGGAGIYYHFDYHGGPRSYQWLNTNPLPKIWDQLTLAYDHGADRVWMVNVGHFKGYEVPMEFFMNMAWNPRRWRPDHVNDFLRAWAAREFPPTPPSVAASLSSVGPAKEDATERTDAIADLVARYASYNARRKPELLMPATYSLVDYGEAERVMADFDAMAAKANAVYHDLPAEQRDAFYELVLFPTLASGHLNRLYLAAARNQLFGAQGRASANAYAQQTAELFEQYLALIGYFDTQLAHGKWAHFMDEPVLGYTSWKPPTANSLNHLKFVAVQPAAKASLGVAIEGSSAAWPGADGAPVLPESDAFTRRERYIEIFNRGTTAFSFSVTPSVPWIAVTERGGSVGQDRRISISVDWERAPAGRSEGQVAIEGAGEKVVVRVPCFNPREPRGADGEGFVETQGCVAIEAEHFTAKRDAADARWIKLAEYGRTLSGMRATGPAEVSADPAAGAPCLEYRMYLFHPGNLTVDAIVGPVLNFLPNRDVRIAVAFDDATPQIVTLVPAKFSTREHNPAWERDVAASAHHGESLHAVNGIGWHTLKVWMIDGGVVLQKVVVDAGGLHPSYLGPPESPRLCPAPAT